MRKLKRAFALLLSTLMVISMLPAAALADSVEMTGADVVSYNLGEQEIRVGSSREQYESGEIDEQFEADGSFTIPLEPDAFFPYEVQFTCEGNVTTEWFHSPTDSVVVGAHTFYVRSEQSGTALTQFGLQVDGDYIAAYPEEKTFTNDGPSISPMSMMPLQEKNFSLDMTGYLPEDLSAVSVDTVLGGLTGSSGSDGSENVAAWAKWRYYDADGEYVSENDDYTVLKSGDTIDLSSFATYSNSFTLELIIGTADQLNLSNVRYLITVHTDGAEEIFNVDVVDEQRQEISVYSRYYGTDWNSAGQDVYQFAVDKKAWTRGEKVYLGLSLVNEKWAERYDIRVLKGYYESYDSAQTYDDITNQIWDVADLSTEGGYFGDFEYKSDYEGMETITVVFSRDGTVVRVMPVILYMYESGLSLSYSGTLYADTENSGRTNIANDMDYDWDSTYRCQRITVELDEGYPVNGNYYYGLRMHNPADSSSSYDNYGLEYVKRAVVGYYKTEADIPETATDIKEQLFTNPSKTGYQADYSSGVFFTIINTDDEIDWVYIKTVPYMNDELPPAPEPLSQDTYFRMNGANGLNAYVMPYDADSYYYNGYQTVLLLKTGTTPVDDATIQPIFSTGNKVEIYAGHDGSSGEKQTSAETELSFESGKAIQYSAAAEDGTNLKNYWVTFLTQQSGPKLFVNATNDESRYDEETGLPVREVFLTDEYDNHHDIFFANIGDQEITGLYVKLEDAQNVALDEYWTVGATTTLSAFTTTSKTSRYGELANVAKVRLVPQTDENGDPLAGDISGTLVIGYNDGAGQSEEVKIKLTGVAGTPKITTESVVEGVKYVPYSSVIQTNNMYQSDAVTFTLSGGSLPQGLTLKKNGEIYGISSVVGTFTFTVTASFQNGASDSKEYTLNILDNTDENVEQTNLGPQGYALLDAVDKDLDVSASTEDALFRSEGTYSDFMAFYLDGKKLIDGVDYVSEEGSTKITIRTQTFSNAGNGTHTISAEFRQGGDSDGTMKRTSQNVNVTGVRSGSSSAPTTYNTSIASTQHGTITVSPKNASAGTVVTINITPDFGYELSSIQVGDGIVLKQISDHQYTFVMPRGNVSIRAVFEEIKPDPATEMPFIDINLNNWCFDSVKYVYKNGLMVGTSAKTFDPETVTTRGMIVTVLYRMSGTEAVDVQSAFSDVAADSYCYDAINWAASVEIAAGCDNGVFCPDDPISRQQVAAILYRYAEYMGYDTSNRAELEKFSDTEEICDYAYDALAWANANGLIVGTSENTMSPQANATRAEIAAILKRFCETFATISY